MATAFKKVRGGTPSGVPLCRTCSHCTRMRGAAESQYAVYCGMLSTEDGGSMLLEWEAVECSAYVDKRLPSIYEMKAIGWQLRTDGVTKKIVGFVSPADQTPAERNVPLTFKQKER